MKVSKLTVKNVLGLNFELNDLGDVVKIAGGNGAGKSRALTVLMGALGVKSLTDDQKAMLKGCSGNVTVELNGGWTATMLCGGGNAPVVKVKGPDGKNVGKGVLQSFIGRNFVNISNFVGLSIAKRNELILKMFGIEDEVNGIQFEINELSDKRVEIFRERKLSEVEAVEKVDEIDSSDIIDDIKTVNYKLLELSKLESDIHFRVEQIESIKDEIDEKEAALNRLNVKLGNEQDELLKLGKVEGKDKLTDKLNDLNVKMDSIGEVNRRAYAYKDYMLNVQRYNDLDSRYTKATERVKIKRAEMSKLMGGVKFPVNGLSYDAEKGGLLHNGQSVWSDSEKRVIALKLAKALKGDLGLAVFENFSLLDKANQESLLEDCRLSGFQVFVELVQDEASESSEGVYFIKDGRVG